MENTVTGTVCFTLILKRMKALEIIKNSWRKLSEQKPRETQGNSFRYIERGPFITDEDYEEGDSKKEKKKEDWSWYNWYNV